MGFGVHSWERHSCGSYLAELPTFDLYGGVRDDGKEEAQDVGGILVPLTAPAARCGSSWRAALRRRRIPREDASGQVVALDYRNDASRERLGRGGAGSSDSPTTLWAFCT